MSWDQIKAIDGDPLFTIGSHTFDHLELTKQPASIQRQQMLESKQDLERRLGHKIRHFCYPYGDFDKTTIEAAKAVGFTTATTTESGSVQKGDGLLELSRVRSVYELP